MRGTHYSLLPKHVGTSRPQFISPTFTRDRPLVRKLQRVNIQSGVAQELRCRKEHLSLHTPCETHRGEQLIRVPNCTTIHNGNRLRVYRGHQPPRGAGGEGAGNPLSAPPLNEHKMCASLRSQKVKAICQLSGPRHPCFALESVGQSRSALFQLFQSMYLGTNFLG